MIYNKKRLRPLFCCRIKIWIDKATKVLYNYSIQMEDFMAYDSNLLRLPDPNTTPAGPGFTTAALTNNSPGTTHRLNNGGTIGVKFAGSYWTCTITYPELFPDEADTILPILHSLADGFETIYLQLPQYIYPKNGVIPASMAGNITKSLTRDDTVVVSNWSLMGSFEFLPGDVIKFTNSNKVYKIKMVSSGVDSRTLVLHDSLLKSVTGAGFETAELMFRVRMEGSVTSQLTNKGTYEGFTVTFSENIL